MTRTVVVLWLLAAGIGVAAQTTEVEVEPVTCWWRTTATSVRVGEPFTVILTCSLLQTEAARVIADESRLEPSVVQLPPFEVVGGSRAKDLTTAGRRFVQFEYQLRVIAENVFASEAALSPIELTYRVESRVAGGDSVAGRDLSYALPRLTMRVLSLVPDTADDIREAPVTTFGEIEAESSRATMLRVAAGVIAALGVLLLILAVISALRRRHAARPPAERALPGTVVLRGVRRELDDIRDAVRASGWTADLAGRALAVARIAAAYATGRPVTQKRAHTAAAPSSRTTDGELFISTRLGAPALVSAAVATTEDEELRDALARFAASRYGREARFDATLDEALEVTIRRANRLAAERPLREKLWPR
jgi:hypothetical protein